VTDILTFGEGPPVLVVHGGPGFDHRYLVEPLAFLRGARTLVYFDQIGCGATPAPAGGATLHGTALQLAELIERVFPSGPAVLLAHSWGTLVVASALELSRSQGRPVSLGGVLINPVPLTRAAFDQARNTFQATVPPDVLDEVLTLAQSGSSDGDIMRPLLPYYFADKAKARELSLPISMGTYASVMAHLGDFSFLHVTPDFRDLAVMLGAADITPSPLIAPITSAARDVHVIAGAGHFPLHEQPEECTPILKSIFARVSPSV
jgi:pimeloyl-ACP methyl ester carboxylesterase